MWRVQIAAPSKSAPTNLRFFTLYFRRHAS
jgi:hypothetical protein